MLINRVLTLKKQDLNMLKILYAKLPENEQGSRFSELLGLLPPSLREKNLRYKFWQDRWRNLLGKLLLLDAMESYQLAGNLLHSLEYTYHGRPYFKELSAIDFNISHSGDYVVCAMAREMTIGIDIEEIKPCNFDDFANTMNAQQWEIIKSSPEPYRQFFTYWAIKESVIKADSRGLSLPLTGIHINGNTATCDNRKWHLHPLQIDDQYSASLSAEKELSAFEPEYRCYV
jgi:4'-phosphopantetheinyl transferase